MPPDNAGFRPTVFDITETWGLSEGEVSEVYNNGNPVPTKKTKEEKEEAQFLDSVHEKINSGVRVPRHQRERFRKIITRTRHLHREEREALSITRRDGKKTTCSLDLIGIV